MNTQEEKKRMAANTLAIASILSAGGPYGMDFLRDIKPRTGRNIKHRATCPKCGARLKNLYKYGDEWLCRKCGCGKGKPE